MAEAVPLVVALCVLLLSWCVVDALAAKYVEWELINSGTGGIA